MSSGAGRAAIVVAGELPLAASGNEDRHKGIAVAPGFHDRTLRMLGEAGRKAGDAAMSLPPELIRWERDVPLPRAFRPWNRGPADPAGR
jgi:hypothetical protein